MVVRDNPRAAFHCVDAIIDFSSPQASVANAVFAGETNCVHVIGTTGFSADDLVKIADCATSATIVRAGNMSLGINLLIKLVEQVAASLDEDFDIEIIEAHHRYKVDAPSGTALMLGEAAATGRGVELHAVQDREETE